MPGRIPFAHLGAAVLFTVPFLEADAPLATRTWRSRVKEIALGGRERAITVLRAVDPTDLFPGECTDLTLNVTYKSLKVGAEERPGPTRDQHRQALQILQQGYSTDRVVDVGLLSPKAPVSPGPKPCELAVDALAPLDVGPDRLGVTAYTR